MTKTVKYFSLLTLLLSTIIILIIYSSPTQTLVDFSVVYGLVLFILIILFLVISIRQAIRFKNWGKLKSSILLLLFNGLVSTVYAFVWNYSLSSILIKIINKTGHTVTEAGIYGCYERNWGNLSNGESKTVRFPGDVSCVFMITYTDEDGKHIEALPRKYFTKNIYYLGTHSNNYPLD